MSEERNCLNCRHLLLLKYGVGDGVCVADHHEFGAYTAVHISAPEYQECHRWEADYVRDAHDGCA